MKTRRTKILYLGIIASAIIGVLSLVNTPLASSMGGGPEANRHDAGNPPLVKIFQPVIIKKSGHVPPLPTPTATPPPGTEDNWVVNGDFTDPNGSLSFEGWSDVNGHWSTSLHDPLLCSPSGSQYLQMDTDLINNEWPGPGSEDWAWQDIVPFGEHSVLHFQWEEAHHMVSGIIQLTIYGRVNGGEWEIVYRQVGVQSPSGTGKCETGIPPAVLDVTIPVEEEFDEYRLEVYGKILHPDDGLLWGDFKLTGE